MVLIWWGAGGMRKRADRDGPSSWFARSACLSIHASRDSTERLDALESWNADQSSRQTDGSGMGRPSDTLRSWYVAGRWVLLTRLAAAGGVAGVASWILVLVLASVLRHARPGLPELLLAVGLGAMEGVLLAVALGAYWSWRRG